MWPQMRRADRRATVWNHVCRRHDTALENEWKTGYAAGKPIGNLRCAVTCMKSGGSLSMLGLCWRRWFKCFFIFKCVCVRKREREREREGGDFKIADGEKYSEGPREVKAPLFGQWTWTSRRPRDDNQEVNRLSTLKWWVCVYFYTQHSCRGVSVSYLFRYYQRMVLNQSHCSGSSCLML